MLRYIITALLMLVLLGLLGMWIISGGPRAIIVRTTESVDNALPAPDTSLRLPWQPEDIFSTIHIDDVFAPFDRDDSPAHQLRALQEEYDRLNTEAQRARTFSNPSPFIGTVEITPAFSNMRASDVREEYIQLVANHTNRETIDITGWSIESALSRTRVTIPASAAPFIPHIQNNLIPTTLEPGAIAILVSGASPVGVSFRENTCTGYLSQFQAFHPPLGEECPLPASALPLTAENLAEYGDTCFDTLSRLRTCRFPQNLTNVSEVCRAHLTNSLSYGGCVSNQGFTASFQRNVWRLFLDAPQEIWRNSHDAIRLLDAAGRTVSVFVY